LEIVKEHYEEILWDQFAVNRLNDLDKQIREFKNIKNEINISKERILNAIHELNSSKSCGNDLLFPTLFKIPLIQNKIADFIDDFFKQEEPSLPDYLKTSRLVLLSKDDQSYAQISNTRPIAV
jgi:hypothetical protein